MLPEPAGQRRVPPAGTADVWWQDVRAVTLGPAELGELGPDETRAAAAFAFRGDRHRYQVAHVLLRRVLAGYLDIAPDRLALSREPCPCCGEPTGRPALLPSSALPGDGPASSGLHFSLTHGGDAVAVAVAGQPVGIDVEQDPAGCVCSLTASMHPKDAEQARPLAEAERHQAVIRWWVRAEAVLKCTGAGIAHGLGSFPVLTPEPGGPAADRDDGPDAALAVHGCALRGLAAPPGYQAALALAGGARAVRVAVCAAWDQAPLPVVSSLTGRGGRRQT